MRLIFGLVLVVGVGLAGFAVYMARDFIGGYQAQLDAERAARSAIVPTVDVFVVNRTLRYGQQITAEDIRAVRWPENAIPEGTFKTMEEIFPEGERNFRTVIRAMEKDEALMTVKVSSRVRCRGFITPDPRYARIRHSCGRQFRRVRISAPG